MPRPALLSRLIAPLRPPRSDAASLAEVDVLAHPAIARMSERELADLPIPRPAPQAGRPAP